MKALSVQPKLVEQVRDAILDEIAGGVLPRAPRIIQEQIAQALGVSRQPVQQALLLLRNQGVLRDAPGAAWRWRRWCPTTQQHMYDLRAVVRPGLPAGGRALRRARGAPGRGVWIEAGRKAVASGSVARLVAADMKFHDFLYSLSATCWWRAPWPRTGRTRSA